MPTTVHEVTVNMSTFDKKTVGGRLRLARGRRTRVSVAEEIGVNDRTVGRWEGLEDDVWAGLPKEKDLLKLAEIYQTDPAWIKYGRGSAPEAPLTVAEFLDVYGLGKKEIAPSVAVYGPQNEELMRLSHRVIGGSKQNRLAVPVLGDCMQGEIEEGDLAIGERYSYEDQIRDGGLYILKIWDTVTVRRLFTLSSGKILVKCSNPEYPEMEVERRNGEVIIMARVEMILKRL